MMGTILFSVIGQGAAHLVAENIMKILFTTALIIATITSLAYAQEGQLRLSPSEINSLASVNAGAGTSGVNGIQTRTLKGDASKSGIYTIQLTIPANVRIQAHTHPDDRAATVISPGPNCRCLCW